MTPETLGAIIITAVVAIMVFGYFVISRMLQFIRRFKPAKRAQTNAQRQQIQYVYVQPQRQQQPQRQPTVQRRQVAQKRKGGWL